MTEFYHIMSFLLLCWMAAIWSTSGCINILVKMLFAGSGAFGAVIVAKDFLV